MLTKNRSRFYHEHHVKHLRTNVFSIVTTPEVEKRYLKGDSNVSINANLQSLWLINHRFIITLISAIVQ